MAPSGRAGTTLIEVIIATLLFALVAVPVMSVALTGRMSSGRFDRRVAAAAAMRSMSESLKAYVTADPALAAGPGAGVDGWSLPGDASGLRALAPGRHDLNVAQWAPVLAPYGGKVSYTVVAAATPLGPQPTATFSVTWDEPKN